MLLNQGIDWSLAELLNADCTDPSAQLRALLGDGEPPTSTDADSQLLAYIPLHNKSMVASLRLFVPNAVVPPTHIKVWPSLPHPLSFEDAESMSAPHDAKVPPPDAEGWCEVQLRFVLFQNVGSLLLLVEGDDDDPITVGRIEIHGSVVVPDKGEVEM